MVAEKTLILAGAQVKQKIRRMAFEMYEHNFNEKSIVVAGIDGQGYILAKLLAKEVESISPIQIKLVKVSLDKLAPQQSDVTLDCDLKDLKKVLQYITNEGKAEIDAISSVARVPRSKSMKRRPT